MIDAKTARYVADQNKEKFKIPESVFQSIELAAHKGLKETFTVIGTHQLDDYTLRLKDLGYITKNFYMDNEFKTVMLYIYW